MRFYDQGTYSNGEGKWEYLVTEYIDGDENSEWIAQPEVTGEECYELIAEILRALRYLHSIGIAHSDVKDDNIRCRKIGGDRQAVLLDLGTAQQFGDSSNAAVDRIRRALEESALRTGDTVADIGLIRDTWFYTERENAHPVIRQYEGRPVTRSELEYIFPFHDLYCVGALLED